MCGPKKNSVCLKHEGRARHSDWKKILFLQRSRDQQLGPKTGTGSPCNFEMNWSSFKAWMVGAIVASQIGWLEIVSINFPQCSLVCTVKSHYNHGKKSSLYNYLSEELGEASLIPGMYRDRIRSQVTFFWRKRLFPSNLYHNSFTNWQKSWLRSWPVLWQYSLPAPAFPLHLEV